MDVQGGGQFPPVPPPPLPTYAYRVSIQRKESGGRWWFLFPFFILVIGSGGRLLPWRRRVCRQSRPRTRPG